MDIAFKANAPNDMDWVLNDTRTDLAGESGLFTAILLSLFTDRLANPDDVIPDGLGDRRGTWMDIPIDGSAPTDFMGSRLWLLGRALATDETRVKAIAYIEEALRWLLDDGIAASVTVTGNWQARSGLGREFLAIAIVIAHTPPPGGIPISSRYDLLWSASTGLALS